MPAGRGWKSQDNLLESILSLCFLGLAYQDPPQKIRLLGLNESTFVPSAISLALTLVVNVQVCDTVLYSEGVSSIY